MDLLAGKSGRRIIGCSFTSKKFCRLQSSLIPCRPLSTSRHGVLRCAALSDGSPQGTSAALNPTLIEEASTQIEFPGNQPSRATPSVKSGRVDTGDVVRTAAESSWEEWLRHFDSMDEFAEDAAHYQVELNTAVRQERYSDAGRFKRKLQDIQAADTVAAVQRQLQDALAAEQYGDAAELRDRGLVGLAGWWAGKDGPEDFQGHLLHVKAEFGRWTGRIYMARDIAAMNGWRENRLLARSDRSGYSSSRGADSSAGGLGGRTIGVPMMEVFVRQQQAAISGDASSASTAAAQQLAPELLEHQAVALRPPPPKGEKRPAAAGSGGAAQLNPASVVRLSIHVARDGSARISVLPPKQVKSEFSGWEEEEMRETMAALAGSSPKPTSPSRDASPRASAMSSLDGFQRPSDDEDDVLTELARMPAQVAMQGRDRFTFTVQAEGAAVEGRTSLDGASLGTEASASGSSVDLPRWAAVPIDDDDSSGDEGEASSMAGQRRAVSTAGGVSDSEVPLAEVEVVDVEEDGVPVARRAFLDARDESAARAAAAGSELQGDEDEEELEAGLEVAYDMLSTGYGKLDAVATSVTDAEEQRILIEIPVGRLIRQQQQQREQAEQQQRRLSGANASGFWKDTFDRLAERVAQLQAARAGRPVPPEHLASALRTLAQRLVNGELAADGSSSATATVPSAAAVEAQKAAAAAAARLQAAASPLSSPASSSYQLGPRRINYSRIPTNLPRSDPFCGLYLGAFGPHGPEIIQLNRMVQDGEDVVCATKVTGDANVPAGEVSFRAKVGRRHRLDSRDVYPDDLGIVARYKGEGRVAMAGYKSPRWVDGELLVFAVGSSPATANAELGFVWSVPGEKRFLILLNKLDLKECEK